MTAAGSPAWARALGEHRGSLGSLLSAFQNVDADAWRRAPAPGTWSPAQIAEHLALVYESLLRELAGDGAMRPRAHPWQQRLLRWFLLPHILFHQNLPFRARSPRELRPSEQGIAQEQAAGRLTELAERFESELARALEADRSLTHPYFGSISLLKTLRFCAVHLEHHRRQMLQALAR